MENHQLIAQVTRRQDTPSHSPGRTHQYVAPPLIHASSVLPIIPEERNHVEVVIEQEIARDVLLLATKMQHMNQNADISIRRDGDQRHFLEYFHNELESCREGFHTSVLQPLFMELINMYHDFGRLIDDVADKEPNATTERTIKNMESFQETLEDILQRYGVETFRVEQKTFLPGKQCILHVIQTPDPTLNRQIARRVRKGFQYKNKVLSPEVVMVYKTVPE